MSTRLEIRVDGEDVAGDKMLRIAQSTLKMLRSVEFQMSGKKRTINWRVDMMSGAQFGLISIWASGNGSERVEAAAWDVIHHLQESRKKKLPAPPSGP